MSVASNFAGVFAHLCLGNPSSRTAKASFKTRCNRPGPLPRACPNLAPPALEGSEIKKGGEATEEAPNTHSSGISISISISRGCRREKIRAGEAQARSDLRPPGTASKSFAWLRRAEFSGGWHPSAEVFADEIKNVTVVQGEQCHPPLLRCVARRSSSLG